jgi:alpha-amylase
VSLISKAHSENIQVYADIVLNHNSGGQLENNPYTGTQTYTDFTGVASGKFQEQAIFIKHTHNNDEGVLGADLCSSNVQDCLLWLRPDG